MSLQENEIDANIVVTVVNKLGASLNISNAAIKRIRFRRPDGTYVDKDAVYPGDGSDGNLKYITVNGDLVPAGTWRCQPYVIKSGVMNGYGSRLMFHVKPNLPDL